MKPLSHRHVLVAGLSIILGVNALALAGVAYNRSGSVESTLQLSERELEAPLAPLRSEENSGLALRLKWRLPVEASDPDGPSTGFGEYSSATWLDEAKLGELGFDLRKPRRVADGTESYVYLPDRSVLLVLELAGPAYDNALLQARRGLASAEQKAAAPGADAELRQRQLDRAKQDLRLEQESSSRLFVVDAGRDAGQLRSRYPDRGRYAIVAGKVGASWRSPDGKPRLTGTVNGLLIPEITVPRDLRAVIEAQERRPGEAPGHPVRFEATVAYGKRLEPWLASLGSR